MFIIIVVWLGSDRPSGLLFFPACFTSFHAYAFLLIFNVCFFTLFHSCCVWENTRKTLWGDRVFINCIWENTRALAPLFLMPYLMELAFFSPLGSNLFWLGSAIKLNTIIIIMIIIIFNSGRFQAEMFMKIIVHAFHSSYSHTEWYLIFFRQCNYKCTMCIWRGEVETLNALVNLNL